MKKLSHKVSRVGDVVTVEAAWRTRMRTPAEVTVAHGKIRSPIPSTSELIHGEAADVFDTLSGIAEIAWELGWRPAGLEQVVAGVVKSYKIPTA